MATKAYAFDMDKLPRELQRTEVVVGAQGTVEKFAPLRAVTQSLSRRGLAAAKVEIFNTALSAAVDLCLETDADGRLANVDHISGCVIVPLPWGEAGYKMWGLRVTECRQLRLIMRQRAERDHPPLFVYDADARRWVWSRSFGRTTAAAYLRNAPITLAEYRAVYDATRTAWSAQHMPD
jgi:hypothetical protein